MNLDKDVVFVWIEYRYVHFIYVNAIASLVDDIVDYVEMIGGWTIEKEYYNVVQLRATESRKQDLLYIQLKYGQNIQFKNFQEISK